MVKRLLVAVVDDDEDIRHSLQDMFVDSGYAVECFGSAEAFLKRVDTLETAIIISDMQMSEMSGLDLAREVRDRNILAPIILITAFASDAVRTQARKLGIRAVLEKPFDPSMLLDEVRLAIF